MGEYNELYDKVAKGGAFVAAGSLVVGSLGKLVAKTQHNRAERIYANGQSKFDEVYSEYTEVVDSAKETISHVVFLKQQLLKGSLKSFLKSYKRLSSDIRFKKSLGISELDRFVVNTPQVKALRITMSAYSSFDLMDLGEKAVDVAYMLVQDGTMSNIASNISNILKSRESGDKKALQSSVDNLKVDSVGAISSFAALAVGYGISGISDAFRASGSVDAAKQACAGFDVEIEKMKTNMVKVDAIERHAKQHLELLERFKPLLADYVTRCESIIRSKDNFLHIGRIKENKFAVGEMEVLAFTFSLVGAVKSVIDTPLITSEGDVYVDDTNGFNQAEQSIGMYEAKQIEMKRG